MTSSSRTNSGSDDGPWTVAIKSDFAAAVAGVEDARLPSLAREWSTAEEWWGMVDPDDLIGVIGVIGQLRALATELTPDVRLYVWICL